MFWWWMKPRGLAVDFFRRLLFSTLFIFCVSPALAQFNDGSGDPLGDGAGRPDSLGGFAACCIAGECIENCPTARSVWCWSKRPGSPPPFSSINWNFQKRPESCCETMYVCGTDVELVKQNARTLVRTFLFCYGFLHERFKVNVSNFCEVLEDRAMAAAHHRAGVRPALDALHHGRTGFGI